MRWGLEQSRNLMTVRAASRSACPRSPIRRASSASAIIRNYLAIALGAGETTVARMVNAYAVLANQGRSVKPTTIDYVQDRHGKVIYRADNRCARWTCNAPDWDGKADAAAAATAPASWSIR